MTFHGSEGSMQLEAWRDRLMEMWAPFGTQCAFAARTGDECVGFQEDVRFEVGSTFKAFVAAEYARQVAIDELDPEMSLTIRAEHRVDSSDMLDQLLDGATIPLQDAAEAMIAVSDNTATDLVLQAVGVDSVRALIARVGLNETSIPDLPDPSTNGSYRTPIGDRKPALRPCAN